MEAFLPARYYQSVSILLAAYQSGTLRHNEDGGCAVTHLLGGKSDWMDVINPTTGRIDHWKKYNHPRQFAKGLQLISDSPYSVEEIIAIEALFEGRVQALAANKMSTLDAVNDPEASIGLSAVLEGLEAMEYKKEEPSYFQNAAVTI